jgi:hypothetical protein
MRPMLRVLKVVVAMNLCAAACTRAADTDFTQAKGSLVVWVVAPATAQDRARIAARKQAMGRTLPTTVQQSSAGDFGQLSSNVGQTAGSYGTPSGNVGTNASDTGRAASDHGQTAGSFGRSAGSFGQAASTYGGGLSSTNGSARLVETASVVRAAMQPGNNPFGDLQVHMVDVSAEELRDDLLGAQGTDAFPDVVVGAVPGWWDESSWGIAMLGSLQFRDVTNEMSERAASRIGRAVITAHALHPQQARAFVLWLRDRDLCRMCGEEAKKEWEAPAGVAVRAVSRVLQGSPLGSDADEAAAPFSAAFAAQVALAPMSDGALDGLQFQFDVMGAGANERLAVVLVRAVMSSNGAFGAVHAVVVLRKNVRGQWKVLQISPGVPPGRLDGAGGALLAYTKDVPPEKVAHVVGISQAAPVDGDARPLQPDLWWDNGGGADMQVVEWQRKFAVWSDTRLMLVPDSDFRVQTRVTARFADASGEYRWRVWSVGTGGAMTISPWKTLKIIP